LAVASVSVGICAYTELSNTVSLVDQILAIKTEDFQLREVIVATPNQELVQRLAGRDDRLQVVSEGHREGKVAALNKILQRVRGDVVVLASADIRLGEDSLQSLVRRLLDDARTGAVDSHVELLNRSGTLMDKVSLLLWRVHNTTLETLDDEGRLGHTAGDLLAFRKGLVEKIPTMIVNDDAFIALAVKKRGLAIRRVQDAKVWVAGPRTPADYVFQRSRILCGHLQLVKKERTIPTTFEFTFPSAPFRNMKLLMRTIATMGASYLFVFGAAVLLEFNSLILAIWRQSRGKDQTRWRTISSTKELDRL
jgi:cellulose synthase/poly-beta-1,6-N-acetylglucosamine synthase-like glycosyltransferase